MNIGTMNEQTQSTDELMEIILNETIKSIQQMENLPNDKLRKELKKLKGLNEKSLDMLFLYQKLNVRKLQNATNTKSFDDLMVEIINQFIRTIKKMKKSDAKSFSFIKYFAELDHLSEQAIALLQHYRLTK